MPSEKKTQAKQKNPGGKHRGMTKSGRKKLKPGPKKKRGPVPQWRQTSAAERNAMLKMAYGGASQAEIGAAFGRHRNTVRKISEKFKWKDLIEAHEKERQKSVMTEADYERAKTVAIYQNVEAALANELHARIKNEKKTGVREEDTIRWLLATGDQKLKTLGVDTSGRPREDDVPGGGGPGLTINIQNLVMMRETAKSMSAEDLAAGIERLKKSIGILEAKEAAAVPVTVEGGDDV